MMFRSYRGLQHGKTGGSPRRLSQTSMLDVEFAQLSDRGKVREHNEDYLGHVRPVSAEQARTHGWLFALADGVGGQRYGEVASRAAVESLLAGFRSAPPGEGHASLLARLVMAANVHIYEAGLAVKPAATGMATTLVACGLRFDRAVLAHVGDSRCYLVRRGNAAPLTRDHTVANDQVKLGILSARQAEESAGRHVLSRSLGGDLFVGVDVSEHLLLPGDVLVLCSDGLHGAVNPAEIGRALNHGADLNAAVGELVGIANQRDGSDNVSIQAIRIRAVERVGMYRGRPYKLR